VIATQSAILAGLIFESISVEQEWEETSVNYVVEFLYFGLTAAGVGSLLFVIIVSSYCFLFAPSECRTPKATPVMLYRPGACTRPPSRPAGTREAVKY
jgi:hypothetical protein